MVTFLTYISNACHSCFVRGGSRCTRAAPTYHTSPSIITQAHACLSAPGPTVPSCNFFHLTIIMWHRYETPSDCRTDVGRCAITSTDGTIQGGLLTIPVRTSRTNLSSNLKGSNLKGLNRSLQKSRRTAMRNHSHAPTPSLRLLRGGHVAAEHFLRNRAHLINLTTSVAVRTAFGVGHRIRMRLPSRVRHHSVHRANRS